MTPNSSRNNLRANKKGISTIFGMIFFILIVVAVFSSFMIIQYQNSNFEQTSMQMRQADNDRKAEFVTISNLAYDPLTGVFKCVFTNDGSVTVQLVRMWIENATNQLAPFPDFFPSISLLQKQIISWTTVSRSDLMGGNISDYTIWVITARGNRFDSKTLTPAIMNPHTVTFTESGLTSGVSWGVSLNGGSPQSSTNNSVVFNNQTDGHYYYSVSTPAGYSSSPSSGSFDIVGQDVTETIVFSAGRYTLNVNVIGGGSVTRNPDQSDYAYGSVVNLTPIPSPGWVFSGWSSNAIGGSVTITSNTIVTATFTSGTQWTIIASSSPGGSITPSYLIANTGDSPSFQITSNPHYHLVDVIDNGVSKGAVTSPYQITNVMQDHVVFASFALDTYTITSQAGANGAISPSGTVVVDYGSSQTFLITANTGYNITDIALNASIHLGPQNSPYSYTFNSVNGNSSIAATFAVNTFTISASADSHSLISPSGTISVNYGDSRTFTYSASTGYSVTRVMVDGAPVAISGSYTFSNIQGSHTIAVSAGNRNYTITASAGSGGSINPSGFVTVNYGDNKTFNTVPNIGFYVRDVIVDGVSMGARSFYTFTNVTVDHMISVTFDTWSSRVSQGIGSLMMDFDDFYYYTVSYRSGAYYYNLNSQSSGYLVNQAGANGLLFRVKVYNADPENRSITLNSQSVFWTTFPWSPQQVRGSAWYLVNVDPITGRIQPSAFTSYLLPYTPDGTPVYLYFASQVPVTTSGSFQPTVSNFDGTAPVNLAVIGTIGGKAYGQNLPFVSIIITEGSGATITATPSAGSVGTQVILSGTNFVPYSPVTFLYDGNLISTSPPTVTASSGGTFSNVVLSIPPSVAGSHTITASDSINTAQTTFTVDALTLSANPINGIVGSIVTLSGTGYTPSSTIAVKYDTTTVTTIPGSVTTTPTGSFSCTFVVPSSTTGNHTITASDTSSNTASATYTVNPSITLNPASGGTGTSVTASGSGFRASTTITLTYDGSTLTTTPSSITTNSSGSFTASFTVPASNPGGHNVTATDGSNSASATFGIGTSTITITSAPTGIPGSYVTIDGTLMPLPQTFTWTIGSTHTLQATGTVPGAAGTQYVWQNWAGSSFGSSTSLSYTYTVPSAGETLTANYKTQYYLTITNGGNGVATGGGWYDKGGVASFSINPTTVAGVSGTQYVFSGWAGTGTGSYNGTSASGTVTLNNPISETANWTTQYQVTAQYSTSDGTTPMNVLLVGTQSGVPFSLTLTMTSQQVWLDAGTSWSINATIPASPTTEQWITTSGTSGSVTPALSIAPVYYHEFKMTLSYLVNGGGSPLAPTFTAYRYGASAPQTLTTSAVGYWFDAGQPWSIINPLSGSGGSERWQTSQTQSGTVNSPQTTVFTYYHQYVITFGYSDQDSSTITNGGKIGSYSQFGGSVDINAGASYGLTSPVSDWADAGTAKVSYQTYTAASGTERWALSASPDNKNVASSNMLSESGYYHQYLITFGYSDQDGSAIIAGGKIGSYTQFGGSVDINAGASYGTTSPVSAWVDAGTAKVSYLTYTAGSGTERWVLLSSPDNKNVASSNMLSESGYYHQFQVTPYYTKSDSSSPTVTNVVSYKQYGNNLATTPTLGNSGGATVWVDAASAVTYTSPINGATGERWQVASGDTATHTAIASVSSAGPATANYYHQFLDTLSYSIVYGGSPTAPNFTANQFGSLIPQVLTTTSTGYWFDAGSAWTTNNPLTGSVMLSERWYTNQATSGSLPSSATTTLALIYYHQYSFRLDFSVDKGNPNAPTLTSTQFGSPNTTALTQTFVYYWLDNGQSWSVTNPITGGGGTWTCSSATSGTVSPSSPATAGGQFTFAYIKQ